MERIVMDMSTTSAPPARLLGVVTQYDADTGRGRLRTETAVYKFCVKRVFLRVGIRVSFRAGVIRAYHVRRLRDEEDV